MKTPFEKSVGDHRANCPETKSRPLGQAIWLAVLLAGDLGVTGVFGGDWPQYRGPNHDGISPEAIRTNWREEPPQEVWRAPLGSAWSSLTVSDGRVFTLVKRLFENKAREFCVALDAQTGAELWAASLDPSKFPDDNVLIDGIRNIPNVIGDAGGLDNYKDFGGGPRSTPSVEGDRVFVMSSFLRLVCLESSSGKELWSHDFLKTDGARNIDYDCAASPLIEGDLVLINCNVPNKCLIALRQTDGSIAWQGQNDFRMTHATPVTGTIAGVRQVIFVEQTGLVSIRPETGEFLWRFSLSPYVIFSISPIVAGNVVYYSAPAGTGAAAAEVQATNGRFTATQLWRTYAKNRNHWATPVHHEGYLYGPCGYGAMGDYNQYIGYLQCLDIKTGATLWTQTNIVNGSVLMAGGKLLALAQKGELTLIDPNPAAYRELGRFQAVKGLCWNAPAIANGRLYIRSSSQIACFDVAPKTAPNLRLRPDRPLAGGPFRLGIGADSGVPLDSNRWSRIQVFAASNLNSGTNGWRPLTNAPVFSHGELWFDDAESLILPQRFYRTEEQP